MEHSFPTTTVSAVTSETIYKICSKEEWDIACANQRFEGAAIDLLDGYIHFSTAAQVKQTARLYFKGREGLVLVAVKAKCLGDDLKWQAARGGELFPHLFATLDVEAATSVADLPVAEDGTHVFPPLED